MISEILYIRILGEASMTWAKIGYLIFLIEFVSVPNNENIAIDILPTVSVQHHF